MITVDGGEDGKGRILYLPGEMEHNRYCNTVYEYVENGDWEDVGEVCSDGGKVGYAAIVLTEDQLCG